jgi:hypothetical protein
MNPRRRLVLMLSCLAATLSAVAAICWTANPYGFWRIALIDRSYRGFKAMPCVYDQHERVTTPYRLRGAQPSLLLVGSSRMLCGIPLDAQSEDGLMNASLPGATIPELAAVVQLAARNPRLREVIWGVDFFAFDQNFPAARDTETLPRLRGEGGVALQDTWRSITENLLNLDVLQESARVWLRFIGSRPKLAPLPPVPWPESVIATQLDGADTGLHRLDDAAVRKMLVAMADIYSAYRLSRATVADLGAAVDRLHVAGIGATLLVFPNSACELEIIRRRGLWDAFEQWKRELLAAAGPYWDFSGFNAVAQDESLFADTMHLRPAAGHVILRELLGRGCERCGLGAERIRTAGVWVDAASIEPHLAQSRAGISDPRCARLVEETFTAAPTTVAAGPS